MWWQQEGHGEVRLIYILIQGKKQFFSCVSPVSYPGFISRPPYGIAPFQLPLQWLSAPAHNPAVSATEQCTGTGEPWSQLNPLLFRFGGVKCTKHPVLRGGNWWEIQLSNNIGKGDISYMGQAWGSCAPLHYLWQGQGIQMPLSGAAALCVPLTWTSAKGQTNRVIKRRLCSTPIPQRTLAQRNTCVHTRNILKLVYVAEMKKDQAVPWFLH